MLTTVRRVPALAIRQANAVTTTSSTTPMVVQNSIMQRMFPSLVESRPSPLMVQARQFATKTGDKKPAPEEPQPSAAQSNKTQGDYFSKPNMAGTFARTAGNVDKETRLKQAMLKRQNTLPIEDWNKKDKPNLFASFAVNSASPATTPAHPEPKLYGTRAAQDYDRAKGIPRTNTEAIARLNRTMSGIHGSDGKIRWTKDSAATFYIFWGIIFFVPISIGLSHKGQINESLYMSPILKKQDWHKKKFGVNWASGGGQVPRPGVIESDYRKHDSFHEHKNHDKDEYWVKIDNERHTLRARDHKGSSNDGFHPYRNKEKDEEE